MSHIKYISQADKQIIDELNEKIDYLQSFFDYFKLNSTNFSKSLQNDINLFASLIKRNEEVFTASIKDKLIFTGEDSTNSFDDKRLDLLMKILKKMNLELKYLLLILLWIYISLCRLHVELMLLKLDMQK